MIVRVMAPRAASAPCPARAGPFFSRALLAVAGHARLGSSRVKRVVLHERTNRGTAETQDEIHFPMARLRETAASGGRIAPELARDRRGRSSEPARNLLQRVALRARQRDLLPLGEREISTGERLR